jgi:hypothetical protein
MLANVKYVFSRWQMSFMNVVYLGDVASYWVLRKLPLRFRKEGSTILPHYRKLTRRLDDVDHTLQT